MDQEKARFRFFVDLMKSNAYFFLLDYHTQFKDCDPTSDEMQKFINDWVDDYVDDYFGVESEE